MKYNMAYGKYLWILVLTLALFGLSFNNKAVG